MRIPNREVKFYRFTDDGARLVACKNPIDHLVVRQNLENKKDAEKVLRSEEVRLAKRYDLMGALMVDSSAGKELKELSGVYRKWRQAAEDDDRKALKKFEGGEGEYYVKCMNEIGCMIDVGFGAKAPFKVGKMVRAEELKCVKYGSLLDEVERFRNDEKFAIFSSSCAIVNYDNVIARIDPRFLCRCTLGLMGTEGDAFSTMFWFAVEYGGGATLDLSRAEIGRIQEAYA